MVYKIEQTAMFFIMCKDKEALGNDDFYLAYKYNSNVNSLNQEAVWKEIIKGREDGANYPFWYYPRGRVQWYSKDYKKHYEIVINKALAVPTVITRIKKKFSLINERVKIVTDTSGELDCILFDKD